MHRVSDSVRIEADVTACEQCGSTSRVGRGLCLNCLLLRCLGSASENKSTLKRLLDEIDVRDADWRIGNYQILEEIGRGGMGVIYRARQRHSRRIVALKRMLSFQADSQETLIRFRREAEAAASLDHPNILPIYEVSEGEDGLPFFSMKFAPGGSLIDAAPALRIEPRRSVTLMAKVARAVQYAHGHGILHRDLKPGNILLDGRGEPLVSDFGLAKWLDTTSDVTRTLTIFGTPGYIAPEQAKRSAAKLTPAADVYSLGAILFELFTGRPPFLGEHALAVIQQAAEKPAPKLRSLIPGFDRDLETICAKCLEREPNARYRSAGDLAEDLERWLEGRPIKTRRVLPSTHAWRWSRRNPALVGTAAVCLLLGAASIWLLREPDWTRQNSAATKNLLLSPDAIALHHYAFYGSVVVDSVGIANGTLLNGASVSAGQLHLDGVDDYVQFDQHIVPTVGDFSVAFFAQELSSQATYTEIISQGFSEGPGFYVGYDASHNFRIGDVLWETGIPFPSDGLLHHYAVTAGTDTRLYIDGTLVATFGPISATAGGDHTRLGRQFDPFAEFFTGNLDDLWVFSGTLTADEVASLAAEQFTLSATKRSAAHHSGRRKLHMLAKESMPKPKLSTRRSSSLRRTRSDPNTVIRSMPVIILPTN
jgi:serine/threonine protein kinase